MYSCVIPDENGEEQTIHFGLYSSGYSSSVYSTLNTTHIHTHTHTRTHVHTHTHTLTSHITDPKPPLPLTPHIIHKPTHHLLSCVHFLFWHSSHQLSSDNDANLTPSVHPHLHLHPPPSLLPGVEERRCPRYQRRQLLRLVNTPRPSEFDIR